MKVLAMRDAKTGLSSTLDEAQSERVLITRNGKPSAIVIGVEGRDFEDVLLMSNPKFWEMIEASRANPRTFSMEEVRAHFSEKDTPGAEPSQSKRAAAPKKPPNKPPQPTKPARQTGRGSVGS